MVQTSARLLGLLALLQSRRFWSGAELAEALEITERSVRRDIDRLRGLGYPVHATAGIGGGYQLGAGKELPPLPLDDEEAVAVAVGLRSAASGPVKGLENASLRALTKLEQVLPKRLRRRVNALQAVSVRMGDAGPSVDAETLTTLANACQDVSLLRFDYRSHEGAASARRVEPYRLVHSSFRWYLLAFDLEREAWRTFRVDRVGPRPLPGRAFKPRPLPSKDVAAYVASAVSGQTQRWQARLTVHASELQLQPKMLWIGGRTEAIAPDRTLLHVTAESLETLAYWLGYLGFEFEVHEPQALVDHVRKLSERLARGVARGR
jgi:predicted DNA-binding transcriptional regulator YafY